MKTFLIIYILLSELLGYSQIDFDIIGDTAHYKTFEEQAKKMVENDWSDIEKVKTIFEWIVLNIEYDKECLKRNYNSNYEVAKSAFDLKKAVCSGYSHLFMYMCDKIDIESKVIDGYSRSEFQEAGLPIDFPNHSWNAVKIDGEWFLLDITWARNTMKNRKSNDYYFLTPKNEFVSNHFPIESKWQMTDIPISKEKFDEFPYISSKYFQLGLDSEFPKKGLLQSNNGQAKLTLRKSNKYSFLFRLYDYNKGKWVSPKSETINNENKNEFLFTIRKGKYLLRIDVMTKNSETIKINKGVLYFTIIN